MYSTLTLLKKIQKTKIEIGLALLIFLFLPVTYNLVESIFRTLRHNLMSLTTFCFYFKICRTTENSVIPRIAVLVY